MPQAQDSEKAELPTGTPESDTKGLLRPTDKRRFFSLSVGGSTSNIASYYGGGGMSFMWEAAIGSHSKKHPNFGGGLVIQQRKGLLNELALAGRVQWDVPFTDAFAIYSTTSLELGINQIIGYGGYFAVYGPPAATLGVSWGVKAILAERFLLSFIPINPMLQAPDPLSSIVVGLRWNVSGGVGVVW